MAKFKKTLHDKQAPIVKSMKTSIVKKRRKKKDNEVSSSGMYKNNFKKLSAFNEIAKNTYTNTQSSNKRKQHFKNKFGGKNTERSNIQMKYWKDGKKNSEVLQKAQINTNSKIKQKIENNNKFDASASKRSNVSTRYPEDNKKNSEVVQKVHINTNSKTKQKLKNKNKLDAKATEKPDIRKYSKDNKRMSEIFQREQINRGDKTKRKKRNKKQKQDINFDQANKDTVKINDAKERKKQLQMPAKNFDLECKETKIEKLKKINEKKMKQISSEVETQQAKPNKIVKINNRKINIKQLEEMLTDKPLLKSKVSSLKPKAQPTLRDRMLTQLRSSRFRFINEILYSNDSSQSKHYFKTDPDAFMAYHEGYKQQLEQWAVNPLDVIISSIKKLPKDNVIADFGCGEARLAASVPHTVHSFDFIALNDKVKACDMAHTPLLMSSVHVVVFCLSLMGSNLSDYFKEANRILKNNGILKIAEVESRFENVNDFIRLLRSYGFKNTWKDVSHNLFHFMDFKKEEDISTKRKILPPITLKSCLYKKR